MRSTQSEVRHGMLMNKLINSEVNRCVLDDAMTGPRLERGARRCMSACHEQLGVWLRHPLHLGKGCEHIQAGRLVKHLLGLPHGQQLAAAAEVVTTYAVVKVRCSQPMADGTGCQAINLEGGTVPCLSLS